MFASQRKSIWFRLTALGFIYLIVLGNMWLALLMIGGAIPVWLQKAFLGGVAFLGVCALILLVNGARLFFQPPAVDEGEGP